MDVNGWLNHPEINPKGCHFCCAITKANLDILGGFDQRFADGYCFDDDEFLFRVKKLLKLEFMPPDEAFVIHQWHTVVINEHYGRYLELHHLNRLLLEQVIIEHEAKTTT
jgi:hypothetical protein